MGFRAYRVTKSKPSKMPPMGPKVQARIWATVDMFGISHRIKGHGFLIRDITKLQEGPLCPLFGVPYNKANSDTCNTSVVLSGSLE